MLSKSLNGRRLYFLITIISGFIILLPSLIFQENFAQGDHGYDLYAYQMVADGYAPYKDFVWIYGPLMPYYYAAFFKIMGQSILAVLLAQTILKFFCGMLIYFIMARITNGIWPYLTSVFFWTFHPYFLHTYNHTGGMFLILFAIFTLITYMYDQKGSYLYLGLASVSLLVCVTLSVLCLAL